MIQIIALRPKQVQDGKMSLKEAFYSEGWRSPSVKDLFSNIDKHIELIPEEERYNIYYTAASCIDDGGRSRRLEMQTVVPFDIDDIDIEKMQEYIEPFLLATGVKRENTSCVFSGHGVQFLIQCNTAILSDDYFDETRRYYKVIASKLDRELKMRGLNGKTDTSVWSAARILRMPNTINRKKDLPDIRSYIVYHSMEACDFDVVFNSGSPQVEPKESIPQSVLDKLPPADPKGVQEKCDFIKHCKVNAKSLQEPAWYAMLSILGRLPNGTAICHEYSKLHDGYDPSETATKLEQAMLASGPRTCENIGTLWDGCPTCLQYGKCNSPISLKSTEYIKTRETGFHEVSHNPTTGECKPGKPNYDDLRRFFEEKYSYVTDSSSRLIYVYEDKFWRIFKDSELDNFAYQHFMPKADSKKMAEFRKVVTSTNLVSTEWFNPSGKLNLQNGVLDINTMQMEEHDKKFGFRGILPYPYNSFAICPRFDKFLDEVTCNREDLVKILQEFGGYALSNIDPAWGEKCLILLGDGSNGKSVFLDVLRQLVGPDNYSSATMLDLQHEVNRWQIDGKLFNVSEETPNKAFLESALFKNIVTGGEVTVKLLYHQPYMIKSRAKFLMACNDLPISVDATRGMFRRLLIVPFDASFEGDKKDKGLKYELYKELPGILNRFLQGCTRLIEQGRFTDSDTVDKQLDEYKQDTDSVHPWQEEYLDIDLPQEDAGNKINVLRTIEVYDSYQTYCKRAGIFPLNIKGFSNRLIRIAKENQIILSRFKNRKGQACYAGIKLKEQQQSQY